MFIHGITAGLFFAGFAPLCGCVRSLDAAYYGCAKTGHWTKIGSADGQPPRRRVRLTPALSWRPAIWFGDAFAFSRSSALFPSAALAHSPVVSLWGGFAAGGGSPDGDGQKPRSALGQREVFRGGGGGAGSQFGADCDLHEGLQGEAKMTAARLFATGA